MKPANNYHVIYTIIFLALAIAGTILLGARYSAAARSDQNITPDAQCTVTFGAPTNFLVSNAPYSVTKSDFNGDGKLDLVTTSQLSNNVSILLGTGTGSFAAAANFSVGSGAISVAVGDFNNDGKIDLVTANQFANSVSILLGTGTGSFSAATNFPVGSPPRWVAVGDFNGDGKPDLATANQDDTVSILIGAGTGSFGGATHFTAGSASGSSPFAVTVADLNGDLKLDLAVANTNTANVSILLGTGTGSFSAPTNFTVGSNPRFIAIADFNGDNKPDLAVANTFANNVSILLGTGTGTFGAATNFPLGGSSSPWYIATGDYNGDGILDLATANGGANNVAILLGTGTGSFSAATNFAAAVNSFPVSVAAADFNGDGKLDLASGNNGSANVSILLNTSPACAAPSPSPSPSPSPTYSFNGGVVDADGTRLAGAHLILTGDTNNDGVTDVVRSTTTAPGDRGLFDFTNLPEGTYIVTVSADNRFFSPDTRTVALPTNFPGGSVTVTLNASQATGNTPTGDNIQITVGGTTLTFQRVIVNGVTRLTAVSDLSTLIGQVASAGGKNPKAAFQISTSAQIVAPVEVCYQLSAEDYFGATLMLSIQGGKVSNIEIGRNDATQTLCGRIARLPNTASASTAKSAGETASAADTDLGTIVIAEANSVIGLSTSSTNVSEGAGTANINVVRTGDTTGVATVEYATSDAAGSSGCNVANTGMASSRCDYETTVGTLTFAAGQTSKTISVPIIDDAYADGLESFTVTLSKLQGAGLANPSSATVVVTDNDGANGANSIDQASFFVRLHYLDFLNREPDASGLGFWSNQITECGTNAACIDLRRTNVSAAFFLSIEFQETGYLVYRFYKAGYGNISGLPVPLRLNEFLPDTQQIGRGVVVGAGNWQAQLEANKQSYALDFVTRQRFVDAYANSMTPAQFVDALFLKAGVTPTAADRAAAIGEFGNAATSADSAARARALRRVAENATLNTQEFNKAFVLMQYFGYLRRNPNDAPDADFGGYNFWLGKLNEFNGNFINAEMVRAFIVSGEYRARFGTN